MFSVERGERLECQVIAPPVAGTAINVEFIGKDGLTPIVSQTDPTAFEVDGRLKFKARPEIIGGVIGVRLTYVGVLLPWILPEGDSLQSQIPQSGQPARFRSEIVGKFIKDFFETSKSLENKIQEKKKDLDSAERPR